MAELVNIFNEREETLFSPADRARIKGAFTEAELRLMKEKGLTYGLTQWHSTKGADMRDVTFSGFTDLFAMSGVILKFDVNPNESDYQSPLLTLNNLSYVSYDLLGTSATHLE